MWLAILLIMLIPFGAKADENAWSFSELKKIMGGIWKGEIKEHRFKNGEEIETQTPIWKVTLYITFAEKNEIHFSGTNTAKKVKGKAEELIWRTEIPYDSKNFFFCTTTSITSNHQKAPGYKTKIIRSVFDNNTIKLQFLHERDGISQHMTFLIFKEVIYVSQSQKRVEAPALDIFLTGKYIKKKD